MMAFVDSAMLVAPSFVTTSIHVLSFSCETARDPHSFLCGLKGKVLDGWNDTWTEKRWVGPVKSGHSLFILTRHTRVVDPNPRPVNAPTFRHQMCIISALS